jgi:ABC-type multidrug transport system ATPase subunit
MEEADALATRAAIMSKRILVVGTTENLRQKYGNMYHVHLVLKTTPISSREEMDAVEEWVKGTFPDARFDSFGNFHGQIKFSVPATLSDERVADTDSALEGLGRKKSRVGALFSLLEENRDTIGLQFYSIRATTMEEVFLNVVKENNVREEGVIDGFTKKHSQWGWF